MMMMMMMMMMYVCVCVRACVCVLGDAVRERPVSSSTVKDRHVASR